MKRHALVVVVALVVALQQAAAQGGVLVQGLVDVEAWKTDTNSTLLRRNRGEPAALYRLRLWSAVEPRRGVFLFAHGAAEGGPAREFNGPGSSVELEQGGIRIVRRRALVIDAGRMVHPLGAFGSRMLSTRNPLIGVPDGYSPVYPLGAMISGERDIGDYRIALVTLPPTHRGYAPEPSAAIRPVVGVGFTPFMGFRIGASATEGPYLRSDLEAGQLQGRSWRSYRQDVIAGELQYGFGHFDFRSEYAAAWFDVPGRSAAISGQTGYVEGRATLSPRVFVAVRGEVNNYPFIRPLTATTWLARRTDFRDVEVGAGFRFTASRVLKASYRVDDWVVTPENASFVRPGGQAIAVQLSQAFDVGEWLARRR
jgi:hypothetical protein